MRRFEISVRAKIIIVLALMYIEILFNVVNRAVAAIGLLALIYLWTYTERRKERREEPAKMDEMEHKTDQAEDQPVVDYPVDPPESKEAEEVASVMVAGGQSEEGDIFEQALRVVAQAEQEHGALQAEPRAVDPVKIIRELLVQCFGEQWEAASFAHFHTFTGNCLFVAMVIAKQSEAETVLHCRVVEVDPEGHFIFPNPVKVEESKE